MLYANDSFLCCLKAFCILIVVFDFKSTFFAQHNCTSKDAQQKYNSRAAQMYREKLSQSAIKAQRTYGTKVRSGSVGIKSTSIASQAIGETGFLLQLHIDESSNQTPAPVKEKEPSDFFQEAFVTENKAAMLSNVPAVEIKEHQIEDKSHEGPSVASALNQPAEGSDEPAQVKSNILQKKPIATKKVRTPHN